MNLRVLLLLFLLSSAYCFLFLISSHFVLIFRSKAMSNVSGASSGSSSGRSGGRVFGVPRLCHCGVQIMELVSKSSNNPYRRYYRCGYAVSKKVI